MKKRISKIRIIIISSLLFLIISLPITFSLQTNQTLTYDRNGNLITGDGKYREYNEFNQLIRVRNGSTNNDTILEEYIYHPIEDRILIKKINNEVGNDFDEVIIYINENFVRSFTNLGDNERINNTYYVRDDIGIIGEIIFNTTELGNKTTLLEKIFYHGDHLGSTTLITNTSGNSISETFYAPYGGILEGGNLSRYDYEGKEYDFLVGDYDFNFRKYNPEIGIFTQPEQMFPNLYDPQSLNRYRFERNNPYKYVDEDGKAWQYAAAILGIGVVSGIIAGNFYLIQSGISNQRPTFRGYSAYFGGGFIAGSIGAGTAIIGFAAGSLGLGTFGGVTVGIGSFMAGVNSQLFTNVVTGRPADENILSSGIISAGAYGASKYLPAPKSATSSQFILNSIVENYFTSFISTVYNQITGGSGSQKNTQQINSAQQATASASSGSGGSSSSVINLGRSSSGNTGSSRGRSSSGKGISGVVKDVVKSVKDFFRRLF